MVLPKHLVSGERQVFSSQIEVERFESSDLYWEPVKQLSEKTYLVFRGKERIEVEAGTFRCLKIEMVNVHPGNEVSISIHWLAPGKGLVKSFAWDKYSWISSELVEIEASDKN